VVVPAATSAVVVVSEVVAAVAVVFVAVEVAAGAVVVVVAAAAAAVLEDSSLLPSFNLFRLLAALPKTPIRPPCLLAFFKRQKYQLKPRRETVTPRVTQKKHAAAVP